MAVAKEGDQDPIEAIELPAKSTSSTSDPGEPEPQPKSPADGIAEAKESEVTPDEDDFHPGWRLWTIIVGLAVTLVLTALENTVVTVAAPVIVTELGLGEDYIWVTNAFFICSAAFQPLIGQLCNVFGRRYIMLISVAVFTLGSGLCGGATNGAMLIAGRAIQGTGSGGIMLLNDIIVSDLVPLRQRGIYVGVILVIYGVGTTLGPFIGGAIVATTSWRWVFYINLPIGGASLVILFLFLQVHWNRETTFSQKMARIDFVGNAVLVAATVAVLYALAYAGILYSWSSWHTLVPLLLGFAGFFLFAWLQGGPFAAAEPVMPPRLFGNRTSVVIGINTWMNSALVFWAIFFLPVYFQAVLLFGSMRTGVALLPQSLVAIPGAAIAAVVISRWGRYKPIHVAGFAIFTLGNGLFSLQDQDTSTARWVIFQCVSALGGGMLLNSQLPAFQAPVPEKDQAAATAAFCFIRSIGFVWGVAIPGAILNNRIDSLLRQGAVSDPAAVALLSSGHAYGSASAAQVEAFPPDVQNQIRYVYAEGLRRVWQIAIAFAGVAFLLSILEGEIRLRENLETEFGLKHGNDRHSRAKREDGKADVEKGVTSGSAEKGL
ncbi:major facilitator superfamily domain-containing protein [Achaetomium macrosporum]|uniref:Major facilitator superfamily domain-containing protein n=1 Tax=Achaetomium macrosporum TaxID=79813 RepID=A0AAN7C651_9PEZI|nr:major facilitator superfamily domain-containing protein [Achaetomium macrosporum]